MNKTLSILLSPVRFVTKPYEEVLKSDVYREGAQLRGMIADMGREAVEGWRPRDVRHESFLNATTRKGLTNEDLAGLYKQHAVLAGMFAMAAAIMSGWFVACLVHGSITALATLGVLAFFVAQFLARSFRACQIERREMISFGEFFGQPSAWVPSFDLAAIRSGVARG